MKQFVICYLLFVICSHCVTQDSRPMEEQRYD